MATAGGVTMPAEVMGAVALDEVVLHGWTSHARTGQELVLDPASTHAVLAFTETSARPENEAGRAGVFGPVVPVPADAPPLDRALGYAGRDPSWVHRRPDAPRPVDNSAAVRPDLRTFVRHTFRLPRPHWRTV